jgi:ribosomal protein S27E
MFSAGADSKIGVTFAAKSIATNVCAYSSYNQFYAEEVADPKSFYLTHPCPNCGYETPPSQILHVDGEHIKCPNCEQLSVYGKK